MAASSKTVREIRVEKWSDFDLELKRVWDERQKREAAAGRRFAEPLYRGLGDARWGLETTLERAYPQEKCDPTLSLLKYYRKAVASKPAVATFTASPFIAAFFAFDDPAKKAGRVCIRFSSAGTR